MNFAEQRLFRTNGEWNRQRIKHHVKGFFGGGTPSTENREFWTNGTIPWVSSKDMKVFRLRETQDYITEAAVAGSATNLVEPGSVLMVVRSGILKHSIPVAINEIQVALNQDIKAFVLRETLDPEFFIYWVTGQQRDLLLEWGQLGATVDSLNIEILRNTVIPLPSLDYQRAIVASLDRETGRIDGLIEKKTRFIALLKEKRAAVITHAVTKGIDPDAPMKDSGVDWLGRVPAHWTVSRLRFHVLVNPSQKEQGKLDPKRPTSFFPMDAIGEKGELNHSHIRRLDEVQSGYSYFSEGDVVVAKVTPCFENGKGAIMSGLLGDFGFGTTEITTLRPDQSLDKSFLYLLTSTWPFRKIGVSHMTGAGGLKRVPDDFFRNFTIGMPPIAEQQAIVKDVENQTARIDGLMSLTERSIDLLREKRAALITSAVTGKIDVRAAA